jgi:hypothetical protein
LTEAARHAPDGCDCSGAAYVGPDDRLHLSHGLGTQ